MSNWNCPQSLTSFKDTFKHVTNDTRLLPQTFQILVKPRHTTHNFILTLFYEVTFISFHLCSKKLLNDQEVVNLSRSANLSNTRLNKPLRKEDQYRIMTTFLKTLNK